MVAPWSGCPQGLANKQTNKKTMNERALTTVLLTMYSQVL